MYIVEDLKETCCDCTGKQMPIVHAIFNELENANKWIDVQEEMDKRNNIYVENRYSVRMVK